MAIAVDGQIFIDRQPLAGHAFLASKGWRDLRDRAETAVGSSSLVTVIGHSRLATSGDYGIPVNNQPMVVGPLVGVHNGVIANYESLKAAHPELSLVTGNDSELLFALVVRALSAGRDVASALGEAFRTIDGSASVACLYGGEGELCLATNHGSLYYTARPEGMLLFASEASMLSKVPGGNTPTNLKPGTALILTREAVSPAPISLAEHTTPQTPSLSRPEMRLFDRLEEEGRMRARIRRCTRCILPETMPFIHFDADGVCNYCRKYRPLTYQGKEALAHRLEEGRKSGAIADCVVAFSGGRDSSYALHWLVREMGCRPLVFTYDWGMVNDLARRNQARMVGRLGVEHVIVAAPIAKKLGYIRANVEAWLKKPDLGLVPLFMAGDKHFFHHMNVICRETGIDLGVWSSNRLEKAEFKLGLAGVYQADPGRHGRSMELGNKLKLASYYARAFMGHPGYLNGSLWDTLTAYGSMYFVRQDNLQFYDYIPWDEDVINTSLIGEYDWETAPDTSTTWRIGDGTAAFYNLIYFTALGFTENDAFRSNQIRQGLISRDKALALVAEENLPRYDTVRDYCRSIAVDFNRALVALDRMPKPCLGQGS